MGPRGSTRCVSSRLTGNKEFGEGEDHPNGGQGFLPRPENPLEAEVVGDSTICEAAMVSWVLTKDDDHGRAGP